MEPGSESIGTAVALFPYTAQDPSCVSLEEGENVDVLEADDGPWWKVRKGGTEGWAPSSFLELSGDGGGGGGGGNTARTPAASNRPVSVRSNAFQVRALDERLKRQSLSHNEASALMQGGAPLPAPTPRKMTMERHETQKAHESVVKEEGELTWRQRWEFFLERDGNAVLFFGVYVLMNIVYFSVTVDAYKDRATYDVLGDGLVMARGSGALLKMNCAFVFLPVCRNLITWGRGFPIIDKTVPLDSNIKFHKYIAYWIYILSTVHCFAHFFNFNTLSTISSERFDQYFPDLKQYRSFGEWAFLTLPGLTGIVIWLCQVLIYGSAMTNTRHLSFEVFWYTHHLFIVFTLMTLLHGAAALFEPPGFWKWLLLPGSLYTLERLGRLVRGSRETVLSHVTGENSGVLAVYMERNRNFQYKAGQYLFLNCPKLAPLQWHPFTITSSPEEKYLSIHMKELGNWTKAFAKLFNPEGKMGDIPINLAKDENGRPILRVDGPFGTASEHVFDSRVAVLIGAGIGVTPYASILKSIFYKLLLAQAAPKQYHLELMRTEKVHFYWICRDRTSFEWFAFLLRDLEERAKGLLEVHTYITERFNLQDVKNYVDVSYKGGHNSRDLDPLTGLKSRTYFGRPDFKRIFMDMADIYPHERVGVFFCGPKVMSRAIRKAAQEASSPLGSQFIFRKENF